MVFFDQKPLKELQWLLYKIVIIGEICRSHSEFKFTT